MCVGKTFLCSLPAAAGFASIISTFIAGLSTGFLLFSN
jgi:hypothetical protein